MSLRTLVTDPRTFFAERRADPSLWGPALVVVLHALLVILPTAFILRAFGDLVTELDVGTLVYAAGGQRVSAPGELVVLLWGNAVVYFGVWLGVAAVVYLVSLYFDGEGPFRRVLAFVGWTLAPTLVPAAATALVMIALFVDVPTFESQAAVRQWVRSTVATHPGRIAVDAVRPLFTVWVVYLWVLAAEYGRDLTRRQAMICVALPGGIALLNAVGTYVGLALQALGVV